MSGKYLNFHRISARRSPLKRHQPDLADLALPMSQASHDRLCQYIIPFRRRTETWKSDPLNDVVHILCRWYCPELLHGTEKPGKGLWDGERMDDLVDHRRLPWSVVLRLFCLWSDLFSRVFAVIPAFRRLKLPSTINAIIKADTTISL